MKTTIVQPNVQPDNLVDLNPALLISGGKLVPQPFRYNNPVEQKFKNEKEFTELLLSGSKILFGDQTLLLDATRSPLACYLLLDFNETEDFKYYIVHISHSKQNFWELFERITALFTLLGQGDFHEALFEIVEAVIGDDKALKKEMETVAEDTEINEYCFTAKPYILLFTDQEKPELIQMTATYSSNWGKYVKSIVLKKYEDEGKLYCLTTPLLEELEFNDKPERPEKQVNGKKTRSTESDHLESTSETIRAVYKKMKSDVLDGDDSIEFNAKQYYISMRKNKNLAFFHIRKNLISLVVLNPEEETKKHIKHHEVKTLTEKVQKFWNGASCTVVIENGDHIEEVIALLKKLIQ
jgi:predicted transport protein